MPKCASHKRTQLDFSLQAQVALSARSILPLPIRNRVSYCDAIAFIR
jgi:hypothetical protein